jgi:hypothetical protein
MCENGSGCILGMGIKRSPKMPTDGICSIGNLVQVVMLRAIFPPQVAVARPDHFLFFDTAVPDSLATDAKTSSCGSGRM